MGVVVCHASESLLRTDPQRQRSHLLTALTWGRLGVDLFFALSGFLITRRLLEEMRRDGTFSLSRFYTRRIFRILPPYMFYLAIIGGAAALGLLPVSVREIRDSILFIRNYTMLQESAYTTHFWSLAVEEHFYLLWPLLLLLAGSGRALWMVPVLGLVIHAWRSLDVRFHLFAAVLPDAGVLFRTDTRIDALLWGCLAALVLPSLDRLRSSQWGPWLWIVILSALALGVIFGIPMLPLWLAVLFPLLVVSTVLFPESLAGRVLEWSPLRWIGRASYSLYLWQTLFLQSPAGEHPFFGMPWLKDWPWNLLGIVTMAAISYYLVERPMIRLGHRLTPRPKQLADDPQEQMAATTTATLEPTFARLDPSP